MPWAFAAGETAGVFIAPGLGNLAFYTRRTGADSIVKSMLEHSRGLSGERRAVELNALVDDAVNCS